MSSNFILTEENYYSPDRPHLSSSDIKTYLKSPELFYHRKIAKDLPDNKASAAMKRGSIFDELITVGETRYQVKVLKEQDAEKFAWQKANPDLVVTESDMDEAMQSAQFLIKSKHLDFDKGKMQEILEAKSGPHLLCGKPDYYIVDEEAKVIDLIDLKFSNDFVSSSGSNWVKHAMEFGYDIQLKMYSQLLKKKYGPDYTVRCANLVIVYNGPYDIEIKRFVWPDTMLVSAASKIIQALDGIAKGIYDTTPTVHVEELVDPSLAKL